MHINVVASHFKPRTRSEPEETSGVAGGTLLSESVEDAGGSRERESLSLSVGVPRKEAIADTARARRPFQSVGWGSESGRWGGSLSGTSVWLSLDGTRVVCDGLPDWEGGSPGVGPAAGAYITDAASARISNPIPSSSSSSPASISSTSSSTSSFRRLSSQRSL